MKKILSLLLFTFFSMPIFAQYSAAVLGMWVKHNVRHGMEIHVKFETYGIIREYGTCTAYFFNWDGTPARSVDGRYEARDGQIAVSKQFFPQYESTIFKDFVLWIPYQQIYDRVGNRKMQFLIQIKDPYGYSIANSTPFSFEVQNRKL